MNSIEKKFIEEVDRVICNQLKPLDEAFRVYSRLYRKIEKLKKENKKLKKQIEKSGKQ